MRYYPKFRSAIKAKYPDLTVIMSMYWSGLNRRAIDACRRSEFDMIDEHAYHDVTGQERTSIISIDTNGHRGLFMSANTHQNR